MKTTLLTLLTLTLGVSHASDKNEWLTYEIYDEKGEVTRGPFASHDKPSMDEIMSDCEWAYGPYSVRITNKRTSETETFICDDFFPTEKN